MSDESCTQFAGERRFHVGLAVGSIDASRRFFSTLLDCEPVVLRDDYVKFEPPDPSVNLSLIATEKQGRACGLPTHYGIQVKSNVQLDRTSRRLSQAGYDTRSERDIECCYAVSEKIWTVDPDGNHWEIFLTRKDARKPCRGGESLCCAGQDRTGQPESEQCSDKQCCTTIQSAADAS